MAGRGWPSAEEKMKKIVIGAGAGYAGDRIEPAEELARSGRIDYIVFECLAERTIALAQQRRLKDPRAGYDDRLAERMTRILPYCHANGVKLITNMGAANPMVALDVTMEIARRHGLEGMKIAAVTGDDVAERVTDLDPIVEETRKPVSESFPRFVSANAYLGAESVVPALEFGADVIITGRVADPSLFLAPMMHEFGWRPDSWEVLGRGTVVGHLLECAGQVTGGYFADPGKKDVSGLGRLGFPLAEVTADGDAVITKLDGTGGVVNLATCREQLLYELGDPSSYFTPDVTADFTEVILGQEGPDRVTVTGGSGRQRPAMLKVSIGYQDGYIGEGEISYAGSGAVDRARCAGEIIEERLRIIGARYREIRYDLIGINALHGEASVTQAYHPYEVRLRVAARTESREEGEIIGNEVEALYTNGPAGGGGARKSVREIMAIGSVFIPRGEVRTDITMKEVK
jgi:hypothetical protein